MTLIIKITNAANRLMYVQDSSAGGTLFTGNRDKAKRYGAQDAAEVESQLPVKSLPGVVAVERA